MASRSSTIPQKLHHFDRTEAWTGLRLKEIILLVMPDLASRGSFLIIRNGLVRMDGAKGALTDADAVPRETGGLTIDMRHGIHGAGDRKRPELTDRMRVIFDDDYIVVVAKAPGVLVAPLEEEMQAMRDIAEEDEVPPLVELLKHYWRSQGKPATNPYIVQRLDEETSGLLVFGKSAEMARELQVQLKEPRTLKREYLAIVPGEFGAKSGTWTTQMGRGRIGLRQSLGSVDQKLPETLDVQMACTHFAVKEEANGMTLLALELETGRTHQIRIHCAETGHPIMGDGLYSKLAKISLNKFAKKPDSPKPKQHPFREASSLVGRGVLTIPYPKKHPKRIMLHATRLSFIHPATRAQVIFEEPMPEDMRRYWQGFVEPKVNEKPEKKVPGKGRGRKS